MMGMAIVSLFTLALQILPIIALLLLIRVLWLAIPVMEYKRNEIRKKENNSDIQKGKEE